MSKSEYQFLDKMQYLSLLAILYWQIGTNNKQITINKIQFYVYLQLYTVYEPLTKKKKVTKCNLCATVKKAKHQPVQTLTSLNNLLQEVAGISNHRKQSVDIT